MIWAMIRISTHSVSNINAYTSLYKYVIRLIFWGSNRHTVKNRSGPQYSPAFSRVSFQKYFSTSIHHSPVWVLSEWQPCDSSTRSEASVQHQRLLTPGIHCGSVNDSSMQTENVRAFHWGVKKKKNMENIISSCISPTYHFRRMSLTNKYCSVSNRKKKFEFHLVTDLKHNLHPIYSLSSGIFLACLRLLLVLGATCFPFLLLLRTIMREMTHFDQPWYSQKISQGSFCSFATGTINCEMAMSLISKRWSNEKKNLSIFSRVVLALHHNRKINWT